MTSHKALEGVTVVELATFIAVPVAGRILLIWVQRNQNRISKWR